MSSGYGSYYYTLKKNGRNDDANVDGNTIGAPSASYPVVFPCDAFNKGDLTGLPQDTTRFTSRTWTIPTTAVISSVFCYNQYDIYIKQSADGCWCNILVGGEGKRK